MSLRVLVTRGDSQGRRTGARLASLGISPVFLPLTETAPIEAALPEGWKQAERVAVTSANALRHAAPALLAALRDKPIHAVGGRTAEAAANAGFSTVLQGPGTAGGLATSLAESRGAVLYLCGRVRRPEFENSLALFGVAVQAIETYDTHAIVPSMKSIGECLDHAPVAAVLLYSVLAAEAFAAVSGDPCLKEAVAFALSPRIATASRAATRFAPSEPNEEAILALLAAWAANGDTAASFPRGQTC